MWFKVKPHLYILILNLQLNAAQSFEFILLRLYLCIVADNAAAYEQKVCIEDSIAVPR